MESKTTDKGTISAEILSKGVFDSTQTRTIRMEKKLLEALLYSHFASVCWFKWTEIEDIKLEGDKVSIIYS